MALAQALDTIDRWSDEDLSADAAFAGAVHYLCSHVDTLHAVDAGRAYRIVEALAQSKDIEPQTALVGALRALLRHSADVVRGFAREHLLLTFGSVAEVEDLVLAARDGTDEDVASLAFVITCASDAREVGRTLLERIELERQRHPLSAKRHAS